MPTYDGISGIGSPSTFCDEFQGFFGCSTSKNCLGVTVFAEVGTKSRPGSDFFCLSSRIFMRSPAVTGRDAPFVIVFDLALRIECDSMCGWVDARRLWGWAVERSWLA